MQLLTRVAPQPAVLVLKPLKPVAAKGTVASYGLHHRRTNHSLPLPPGPCNVRGMGHRSCPPWRTKAREEAEPEPLSPAKEVEEALAPAQRNRGERSLAYQIFEAVYVCAYVLSCRIGELIAVNAQDALERLHEYVRDKFNRKH